MERRIILLYGGESAEHDVSVHSACYVSRELKGEIIPVGITRDGSWYLQDQPGDTAETSREITVVPKQGLYCGGKKIEADYIFPLLHGSYGEDGTIQGLISFLPYKAVTASLLSSSIGISKHMTKQLCRSLDIPVPSHRYFRKGEPIEPDSLPPCPLFLKPDRCGSSVGISFVETPGEVHRAAEKAFCYDSRIIIEEAVNGYELQCAWIHTGRTLFLSQPGEIHVNGKFHSYETKYGDTRQAVHVIPSIIDASLKELLTGYTEKLLKELSYPLYGRIDFFAVPDSQSLYFNEINTIPGMTSTSMFPKLCRASGLELSQALDMILEGADAEELRQRGIQYRYIPGETDGA